MLFCVWGWGGGRIGIWGLRGGLVRRVGLAFDLLKAPSALR